MQTQTCVVWSAILMFKRERACANQPRGIRQQSQSFFLAALFQYQETIVKLEGLGPTQRDEPRQAVHARECNVRNLESLPKSLRHRAFFQPAELHRKTILLCE